MKNLMVILIIFLSIQGSIWGQVPDEKTLSEISEFGKILYDYDIACYKATDSLMVKNPDTSLMGLFLAHYEKGMWSVGFGKLNDKADKFLLAYEAVINDEKNRVNIIAYSPVKETSGFYLTAAKAQNAAMERFKPQCKSNNYAVLPKDEKTFYVYFYPAQDNNEKYLLGGDFRYTYDILTQSIKEELPLHKSILEMPMVIPKEMKEEVKATFARAVISPAFVETDILYILYRKFKALHYVSAGNLIYKISEDGDLLEKTIVNVK